MKQEKRRAISSWVLRSKPVPPTSRQSLVCVVYDCYYRYKILEEDRMSPEHS